MEPPPLHGRLQTQRAALQGTRRHGAERLRNARRRVASGENKARLRLFELVDPAIATLAREMKSAQSSADRQRAANSILDHAGYGRASKVEPADARALLLELLLELRAEAQHSTAVGSLDVVERSVLEQEHP